MDIRLSDGDRIGKPQGKGGKATPTGKTAPAKVQAKAPQAKAPPVKTRQGGSRAEPRIDPRDNPRNDPRYESYDDLIPDGRGGGRGGNGDDGRGRRGKPAPQPRRGSAKPAKAKKRRRSGLFGLFYWLFVLGFWGSSWRSAASVPTTAPSSPRRTPGRCRLVRQISRFWPPMRQC